MSARRQARASFVVLPESSGVPPRELAEADAPVWRDPAKYVRYMTLRGWLLPPSERFGVAASPGNRRMFAAQAWARATGITLTDHYGTSGSHADLHKLRDLGFIPRAPEEVKA